MKAGAVVCVGAPLGSLLLTNRRSGVQLQRALRASFYMLAVAQLVAAVGATPQVASTYLDAHGSPEAAAERYLRDRDGDRDGHRDCGREGRGGRQSHLPLISDLLDILATPRHLAGIRVGSCVFSGNNGYLFK